MDPNLTARVEKVTEALEATDIEARWIEPSLDLTYLTGLSPLSLERIMGLVLIPGERSRMIVPAMLAEEVSHLDCDLYEWGDGQGPDAALRKTLAGIARVHVSPTLPLWVAEKMRTLLTSLTVEMESQVLTRARAVKDEAERDALRRAASVTDDMVTWVAEQDLSAFTERELSMRIAIRYMEQGHTPWPDLLVASGSHASMPHHIAGDTRIDRTQPLLIDIGAKVGHYESDTTRMLFPERIEPEVEEAYEAVTAAYDAAFEAVAVGVAAQEVDRAARSVIEDAGFGERFIHRTGHGVGLDIHEEPYLRAGNAEPLQEGNVFSIEPGIYVPGRFGLRYENLVLLGPGGPEALNKTPRRHRLRA